MSSEFLRKELEKARSESRNDFNQKAGKVRKAIKDVGDDVGKAARTVADTGKTGVYSAARVMKGSARQTGDAAQRTYGRAKSTVENTYGKAKRAADRVRQAGADYINSRKGNDESTGYEPTMTHNGGSFSKVAKPYLDTRKGNEEGTGYKPKMTHDGGSFSKLGSQYAGSRTSGNDEDSGYETSTTDDSEGSFSTVGKSAGEYLREKGTQAVNAAREGAHAVRDGARAVKNAGRQAYNAVKNFDAKAALEDYSMAEEIANVRARQGINAAGSWILDQLDALVAAAEAGDEQSRAALKKLLNSRTPDSVGAEQEDYPTSASEDSGSFSDLSKSYLGSRDGNDEDTGYDTQATDDSGSFSPLVKQLASELGNFFSTRSGNEEGTDYGVQTTDDYPEIPASKPSAPTEEKPTNSSAAEGNDEETGWEPQMTDEGGGSMSALFRGKGSGGLGDAIREVEAQKKPVQEAAIADPAAESAEDDDAGSGSLLPLLRSAAGKAREYLASIGSGTHEGNEEGTGWEPQMTDDLPVADKKPAPKPVARNAQPVEVPAEEADNQVQMTDDNSGSFSPFVRKLADEVGRYFASRSGNEEDTGLSASATDDYPDMPRSAQPSRPKQAIAVPEEEDDYTVSMTDEGGGSLTSLNGGQGNDESTGWEPQMTHNGGSFSSLSDGRGNDESTGWEPQMTDEAAGSFSPLLRKAADAVGRYVNSRTGNDEGTGLTTQTTDDLPTPAEKKAIPDVGESPKPASDPWSEYTRGIANDAKASQAFTKKVQDSLAADKQREAEYQKQRQAAEQQRQEAEFQRQARARRDFVIQRATQQAEEQLRDAASPASQRAAIRTTPGMSAPTQAYADQPGGRSFSSRSGNKFIDAFDAGYGTWDQRREQIGNRANYLMGFRAGSAGMPMYARGAQQPAEESELYDPSELTEDDVNRMMVQDFVRANPGKRVPPEFQKYLQTQTPQQAPAQQAPVQRPSPRQQQMNMIEELQQSPFFADLKPVGPGVFTSKSLGGQYRSLNEYLAARKQYDAAHAQNSNYDGYENAGY